MSSSVTAQLKPDLQDSSLMNLVAFNEKMAELGRISSGIMHEINTPLSVIVSAAQLVMQEDDIPDAARELVERIHQEAQRLSRMTRGILSFARRDDDEAGETDLSRTIHEVVLLLRYEIGKRSVEVEEWYDEIVPLLPVGRNRIKQVVLNLAMNALQAMDGGGRLTLSCMLGSDGAPEIRVTDTGHGIPAANVSRIFDPFFTTKDEGEGTGLGLFVSKSLVEAMGGTLTIQSQIGAGTSFTIRLPAPSA